MHKMAFYRILIVLLLSIPILGNAQSPNQTVYYGNESFLLEGTQIADSLKENRYDRLPLSLKGVVRDPVWNLSKSSAGMSIRFFSNSTSIHVKWTLLFNNNMPHMAETGIKGVDLYFNNGGDWQYLNTARPKGIENESLLIDHMSGEMREYRMYLPLYDGVSHIEVGIDSGSVIKKPLETTKKSIIFYGTSITQGGCASRPGMAHTNIISRKLNMDCINLGFSGNGRMEVPINELIAGLDPAFYVIECLPNMNVEQITERTIPLVKTIRQKHAETPILLVENFIYENSVLNQDLDKTITDKNIALKAEYDKMMKKGFESIHYIRSEGAMGEDHEGTVDGVHFTDLGFLRYADFLIDKFEELGLVTK
ncbi:MAG: SGNH/GDSL hydrolase family protein [Bacteroidota bacterium]